MQKLYVAMVGLPASGKSTLARRIRDDLTGEGIRTAIFNNGEMRRRVAGPDSATAEFYAPDNEEGRDLREQIALKNMEEARRWLEGVGQVVGAVDSPLMVLGRELYDLLLNKFEPIPAKED